MVPFEAATQHLYPADKFHPTDSRYLAYGSAGECCHVRVPIPYCALHSAPLTQTASFTTWTCGSQMHLCVCSVATFKASPISISSAPLSLSQRKSQPGSLLDLSHSHSPPGPVSFPFSYWTRLIPISLLDLSHSHSPTGPVSFPFSY